MVHPVHAPTDKETAGKRPGGESHSVAAIATGTKPKKCQTLGSGISLSELGHEFESPRHEQIFRILHNPAFDYTMGFVILVNFAIVVIETDHVANDEDTPVAIDVSGWLVLLVFIVELAARLFVLGRGFFGESWNIFDFTIVSMDTAMSILGLFFGDLFPLSALRILRLCKLARVSKVFRVFPELRLMMAGLIGSLKAIFWGTILLLFFLSVWAVIAVQFIHPINKRVAASGVYEKMGCDRCPDAFSSVAEATLTFSQQIVAGDSWGQVTIPIIYENTLTSFFFAVVFVSIGMAVLNLILGVVVNIATQAHDSLASEIDAANLLQRLEVNNNLLEICAEMDEDSSGQLTKLELLHGFRNNEFFRKSLEEMQIGEADLEIVWTILDDDKSGTVCYNEFVSHCYKMRMSDTQFMLAYIKYYITVIKDKICQDITMMKTEVNAENKTMEKELEQIAEEERKMAAGEAMQMEQMVQLVTSASSLDLDQIGQTLRDQGGLPPAYQSSNSNAKQSGPFSCQSSPEHRKCAGSETAVVVEALEALLPSKPPQTLGDIAPKLSNGDISIESKLVYDTLEETRQMLAQLCGSTIEIKSRLDLCMPVTGFEPKLLDTTLLALPQHIPRERSCPAPPSISGCCGQGSRPSEIIRLPPLGVSPGHQLIPVNDFAGSRVG